MRFFIVVELIVELIRLAIRLGIVELTNKVILIIYIHNNNYKKLYWKRIDYNE